MSDFFRSLGRKVETKPDAQFDRAFWKRFEGEFGRRESWLASLFTLPRLVPAGAALAVAAGILYYAITPSLPTGETAAVVANAQTLEDLDLFLDGELVSVAEVDTLDDADWDVLLEENG